MERSSWVDHVRGQPTGGAAMPSRARPDLLQPAGRGAKQDQPLLQHEGSGVHCPGHSPGESAAQLVRGAGIPRPPKCENGRLHQEITRSAWH